MAKMRVHELAKEFGMTSKEMLGHLEELKIPAKNHASTLEEAYIDKIRKVLAPVMEERKAAIEAQAQAEAEKKAQEEELARIEAEKERLAAEERAKARREEERRRREEAEARAKAEEEARAKAEAEARAQEREAKRQAELERKRASAPKSLPGFGNLLEQIEQEQRRLREQKEQAQNAAANEPIAPVTFDESLGAGQPGKKKKGAQAEGSKHKDRYSEMAEEAQHQIEMSSVLKEAQKAVREAQAESGSGKRKKRKEKRERERAERDEQEKLIRAKEQGINPDELDTVRISEGATVSEVAEALGVAANDIIKQLFILGTPLTLTQSMDNSLIELVAMELNRSVKVISPEEENSFTFYDDPEDLTPRPPVVTVMGHVDHGKTSLLDAIRDTGVAAREAGGITQAIGASVVFINDQQITFIDTPGHEAFTAMRARGAKITDIVILVVAADDGVMPQTIEAINHSKAAGVPLVVAVNKIDRPQANPDRVRNELVEHGVIPEEWGGDNMFVNVSAKQREGIDELLETVLLQAEVLELKANSNTFASGYVVEAKLDKGRGPVATVLVNRGTLKVGDAVVAGTSFGRVRALLDPHGNQIAEVGPAGPAEILGLDSVPQAGDEFRVFEDERDARSLAEERALKQRIAEQNRAHKGGVSLENLFDSINQNEVKDLNLIVKADVQGSIEALADALSKMDQSEVRINIIHSAVGGITETDVTLADASSAIIIGFNVRPSAKAKIEAEQQNVQIRTYRVIYQALDDINAARVGMLSPTIEERDTGAAEVRDLFRVPKVGVVAGCYVTDGEISRNDKIRIVRDGTVIFEGELASLRRFKDDVKSVKSGYECGIGVEGYQDLKEGDIIEGYEIVEVAREA